MDVHLWMWVIEWEARLTEAALLAWVHSMLTDMVAIVCRVEDVSIIQLSGLF